MNITSSIVSIRCKENRNIRCFLVNSPAAGKWVKQILSSNRFEFVNEILAEEKAYHPERTQTPHLCVSFG